MDQLEFGVHFNKLGIFDGGICTMRGEFSNVFIVFELICKDNSSMYNAGKNQLV